MLFCDKFEPRKKLCNSFVLKAGDSEEMFMLRVAKVLLLFRLNRYTHSNGTYFAFLEYIECTPAQDELRCVCECVLQTRKSTALLGKRN